MDHAALLRDVYARVQRARRRRPDRVRALDGTLLADREVTHVYALRAAW